MKKTNCALTSTQTVVMISTGTINVFSYHRTFTIALLFMEWLQVKSNLIETFLTGKARIVIDNGHVHTKNLKRMWRTPDQLEMQLKLQGVSAIQDVKKTTLEANGRLGLK
ncbi:YetF domain-containing protein [Bacillus rugosus]|uniref:YetF domain-containing protein n=1 Tax=Bacillus rugosus TaxID=2715209 RepID=UPI0035A30411